MDRLPRQNRLLTLRNVKRALFAPPLSIIGSITTAILLKNSAVTAKKTHVSMDRPTLYCRPFFAVTLRHLLPLAMVLLIAACAAPIKEPEPSGFLRDYERLEPVADNHLRALNPALADYRRFIVERPIVLYQPAENGDQFSPEELDSLKEYTVEQFTAKLVKEPGFEVVTDAGPETARIRFVVTDLDATDGVLNVSLITKATGAGLGGVAVEMEVSDSRSGEELLAVVRWGSGSRVLRAGFTRLGDAKIQIGRWASEFRKLLDELSAEG